MKRLIVITAICLPFYASSQLLFPESFVVIFDTTRNFKGSISPSLEIKTQRQLYVELTNRADVAFRFKNHGITAANKFELTRDGSETILSGGFMYGKFKTFYDNPFVLEHYVQYQWAEARGLNQKIAVGSNLRYKIFKSQKGGAFAGVGPFYEYELWNYRGVPEDRLPLIMDDVERKVLKLNVYLSTKRALSEKIRFEGALYFQDEFNDIFNNPRWAGSTSFSYSFTENIAFAVNLQVIYDFAPLVPIDKFWLNTFSALEVTF
ncbi:DUF481 domain-containing protein [Ekhidna sp.]|uniref:DUF481 domain-containing protein n=1 Tax=Ekhidna sp. TaxID=2608089 RepID=UPI003297E911